MSEAKEYLEQIKLYDAIVDSGLEELAMLKSKVKRITPTMKDGGGSGNSSVQDRMAEAVAKIVDLQEEINRNVDIFVDSKREAGALLKKVRNADFYKVLHMRYIQYKSFAQIAAEMGLTERGASKLNGRALQAFDKVLRSNKAESGQMLEENFSFCTESSGKFRKVP